MARGVVVSVVLFAAMLRAPVTAELADRHLAYDIGMSVGIPIVLAYVTATCGAVLFSGRRYLAVFGAVNLVAVVALARFEIGGFASLWCAWAAVTSGGIAFYLRQGGVDDRRRLVPVGAV